MSKVRRQLVVVWLHRRSEALPRRFSPRSTVLRSLSGAPLPIARCASPVSILPPHRVLTLSSRSIELKLADEIDVQQISLMEAENMSPAFLKKVRVAFPPSSPAALTPAQVPSSTLPSIVDGDKVYGSTTEVVEYLIKKSSVSVAPRTKITELVHEQSVDPNFQLVAVVRPPRTPASHFALILSRSATTTRSRPRAPAFRAASSRHVRRTRPASMRPSLTP
jgi:hypothetical protein